MKVVKNFYYDIRLEGFKCYIMKLDVELNVLSIMGNKKV